MVINFENAQIGHGTPPILNECNLRVEAGELVYIQGPVGSGKSTLLRTIFGAIKPMGGTAVVLGEDMMKMRPSHLPQLRKQIGIDLQDFHFLPGKTVCENLDFVLRATGWKNRDERRIHIIEVLEEVDLAAKINSRIHELSAGEKQRVSIARAILNNPKLILADAPAAVLDRQSGEHIVRLLNAQREKGTAVVIATHNPVWTELFPGTVYRCEEGRLIKDGKDAENDSRDS